MNVIRQLDDVLSDHQTMFPDINLLKELILVRDSSKSIDGFNYNEICEMIDDISTSFI